MADIRIPWLLYTKAVILLLAGILASVLLLLENPTFTTAALLAVAIWAFCRSYYFAFYVIEHYIHPEFRYAGLLSFVKYLLAHKQQAQNVESKDAERFS
jgi:hypothetical protein